ncbi:zinc finger CCCH domain-containing protein 7B-like isoform X2 [Polypterus senegalus]|uniref:zinc finger CCCH domain-containing protein 7B-like isoform X2 n=1 Tax=Polypterus senegalus TaxID=55291 RepID=UPI0019652610|nr:zinc finger CCCH domain-containing protein 7B-like isoform X2 [Polypterus senegalus]
MDRQKRKSEIQKALTFMQSSLPFPEPLEYQAFLHQLIRNLLEEGNDLYREGDYKQAVAQYTEGVSVVEYAESDSLAISSEMLEHLFVNRGAAYFQLGLFQKSIEDCDAVIKLNNSNARALYRKARALKELGQVKDAYESSTRCLLTVPHDEQVTALAQELASMLGLKIRKAYIGPQDTTNGVQCLDDIAAVPESSAQCIPAPLATSIPVSDDPSPSSPDLEASKSTQSGAPGVPFSVPESIDDLVDGEVIGEELDNLLDSMSKSQDIPVGTAVQGPIPTNLPSTVARLIPIFPGGVTAVLPSVMPQNMPPPSTQLPPAFFTSVGNKLNTLDSFDVSGASPSSNTKLDSLDTFDAAGGSMGTSRIVAVGIGLDSLSEFSVPGSPAQAVLRSASQSGGQIFHTSLGALPSNGPGLVPSQQPLPGAGSSGVSLLAKNPLSDTHEFRQACPTCFIKTGPKAMDYTYKPDVGHKCKKDILLCRIKESEDQSWKRIRPRPARNNFLGSFVLCKEIQSKQECKYGENCTFAYCQEEIDVWTQERKGALNRELLFNPLGGSERRNLTVSRLLQTHQGMFMFLCEECFDSKPRIISKRSKDNLAVCSNLSAKHLFDMNKCLVHVVRSTTVRYSKVRPLHPLCQFDVCRHEVRYGCQREDSCSFAHSIVELKTWVLQQDSGITHEEIVQESKKYWQRLEQGAQRRKPTHSGVSASCRQPRNLNLKMKFVCGQCWRDGQVSEPDKELKYCTAKARHSWTKERRVLLVMSFERKKWVVVRPLPFSRAFPQQYDMCVHVVKEKKCHYIGKCSFAHSPEERDVWTYMKDNNMRDMQQMYDLWLKLTNQNRQADGTLLTTEPEEKQIVMPTDYAETMSGFHCRLCGKNSNSERQWQQHISSEKHKEKVFSSDGEENVTWKFRFPGKKFEICDKLADGSCSAGSSCEAAHSSEELAEWQERRDFLRKKLARARDDMLIAPSDTDFGKYNFLLQD